MNTRDNPGVTGQTDGLGSGSGALAALLKSAGRASGAPPVHNWDPPYCGNIGLKIRADGVWLYQGSPVARIELVKLFASILRKDPDGKTYLVTPAEKVDCDVEDAHFLAVEMAVAGAGISQSLTFRTNVDDVVTADRDHPLHFVRQDPAGGLKPYILVRGRLLALVTRAVYVDLINLALPRDTQSSALGLWSNGVWWPLESSDDRR